MGGVARRACLAVGIGIHQQLVDELAVVRSAASGVVTRIPAMLGMVDVDGLSDAGDGQLD